MNHPSDTPVSDILYWDEADETDQRKQEHGSEEPLPAQMDSVSTCREDEFPPLEALENEDAAGDADVRRGCNVRRKTLLLALLFLALVIVVRCVLMLACGPGHLSVLVESVLNTDHNQLSECCFTSLGGPVPVLSRGAQPFPRHGHFTRL